MICFTCDIHHLSLDMPYMPYSDKTELEVAALFLNLLEKYNVKATMFMTGKCFTEEWNDAEKISKHPLVEIGGHNYYCFKPFFGHRVVKKALGPYWYQYHDVSRTVGCIRKRTGKKITAWRNHMLIHGPHTEKVLSKLGFKFCSDEMNPTAFGPEWHINGIYNFPINIISDYDHIYHAHRTEKYVKSNPWTDVFGSESFYIEQWVKIVLEQIKIKLENNSTVNILIHPITMYLSDRFAGVERILKFVSSHENCFFKELPMK